MITALYDYITSKYPDKDLLTTVLSITTNIYQDEFSVFADCGAGVGYSTLRYIDILSSNLKPEFIDKAIVVAYEPLPENLKEMGSRLTNKIPRVIIRNLAVSNFTGHASFTVPKRMTAGSSSWSQGTSAVGYLGKAELNKESISVPVIRLDEEPYLFDFLKFDLQGGERLALDGLGDSVQKAKILYIEQQLLGGPEAPDPMPLDLLVDQGFICFYDEVQFGVNPLVSAVPIKLLENGGVRITQIFMPNGRGLPGIYRGSLSYCAPNSIDQHGRFTDDYIAALKLAGVSWMATDILAIHKDCFSRIISNL